MACCGEGLWLMARIKLQSPPPLSAARLATANGCALPDLHGAGIMAA